jgi:hypothetical protein
MPLIEMWLETWGWFVGAALGIATMLTAAVYVLSELLLNEKMKTWAKMELVEIFYSAVIVLFAASALPVIDSVVQGAILVGSEGGTAGGSGCPGHPTSAWIPVVEGGNTVYKCYDICGEQIGKDLSKSVYGKIDACHMRLAIWYLREIFDETKNFAFDVYLSYIKTSMIAEFTINVELLFEKAGFFTFAPWRGFYTMGNTIKTVTFDWAIKIMMLTKFQEVMLRFIATALFPALFVMGVILRTFTFTRRLGGLLLGMAIAMYFIFPAFYAFGAVVVIDLKHKAYNDWVKPDNPANPANRDINPLNEPRDFPNPPIANSMYIRGDIQTIGGDGKLSTGAATQSLMKYETMGYEDEYSGERGDEFLERMEADEQRCTKENQEDCVMPKYDFNAERKTESEENDTLNKTWAAAENWFGNVSKESKMDKLITFAWEPNGPIETLSRLTFWSLFFSLFGIIATIAATRSLSMTFGGDIEIAGLTRLI